MHNFCRFCKFNEIFALFFTFSIVCSVAAVNPAPAHASTAETTDNDEDDTNEVNRNYYTFGVFPYLSPRDIAINYGPVSAEFNQVLKHEIRLRTSSSFEKFTEKLNAQYYDIAVIQPFDYRQAVEHSHYVPLARVDEPLVSVFAVKNDSPFKTLSDLRGKRLAFPPKPAANSRMAIKALVNAGLVPGKDIFIQYYPSHVSCMHEVIIDEASACVTGPPIVKIFNERMNAHVRILTQTDAIPHILYVAHERVPAEQRRKLQKLITSWRNTEHGQKLLHSLGFPGFAIAKPSDYDIMRTYGESPHPLAQQGDLDSQTQDELVLGVFPYLPPKRLAETFAPLPALLSNILGKSVAFRTTSSYAKYTENLENRAYDIALVQPFDYELAINNDYVPFAQRKGKVKAGFFVLQNSSIHSLQDLKGTTIAMPPYGAALTRLALRELRWQGITPGKNIEVQYRPTLDSCLFQLRRKLVSACAAWAEMDALVSEEEMRGIKLLLTTDSVPAPFFVVKKGLPEPMRAKLAVEMTSWQDTEAGRRLLQTLRIGPFEKFNAADYETLLQKRQEFQ